MVQNVLQMFIFIDRKRRITSVSLYLFNLFCSRACDNCQNLVDLLHHCFKTNRPAADPENIIDVEGLDEFIIMECIYAALFISSQSASNYYPGRPFPCHNGLYSRARTHVGRRPFVILTIISHCLQPGTLDCRMTGDHFPMHSQTRDSDPGPAGSQSGVLTTIPHRPRVAIITLSW